MFIDAEPETAINPVISQLQRLQSAFSADNITGL